MTVPDNPGSSRFSDWELLAKALLLIHGETVIDEQILDAVARRCVHIVPIVELRRFRVRIES